VPFTTTACAEGEAGVVLAGVGVDVPLGVTVALTVGEGLDAGDVVVAGVGGADTVADGLPGEVPVGVAVVDGTDFGEQALIRRAPQRPITGHNRPDQPMDFLPGARHCLVSLTLPHPAEVPQIADLVFRSSGVLRL
jgi:hypothetical protein